MKNCPSLILSLLSLAVAAGACSENGGALAVDANADLGVADAAADTRVIDARAAADTTVPADSSVADASPDAMVPDGAASDVAPDATTPDAHADGGASPGADGGVTCGPASREMLCTTYCSGMAMVCTGSNSQFASADACRAACNGPTWACGDPGDTTGNSLFCRMAHMALAGVGGASTECSKAGPKSAVCQ